MLKVIELFSGIGSQTQALKNIGIEHEVVAISEIDNYAIESYEEIHGKTKNLGDITEIDVEDVPDCDLLTYSFPCQDISIAGKQKGLDENSNTRSSLLWECHRIIKAKRPKYLLLENVKNLVGKKHKDNFDKWLKQLNDLGYNNYWEVLNACDYGVPQNRERVFVVSIRKDVDDKTFTFPKKQELKYCLNDFLEKEVDEKYYLSKMHLERFVYKPVGENVVGTVKARKTSIGQRDLIYNPHKKIGALTATDYKSPKKIITAGTISDFKQTGKILDVGGICSTLDTMTGGNRQPKIFESDKPLRLRKLTPLECWRLMGFKDEEFYKAQNVNSNTQLYKQAGNSIVVNVLEAIFSNLFKKEKREYENILLELKIIRKNIDSIIDEVERIV